MRRTAVAAAGTAMAAVVVTTLGAGAARADELHEGTTVGPQFALVSIGQIENPLGSVLQNAQVLPGQGTGGCRCD
ncbi:hypothetical protein ACTWP5_14685 [Streptomyces sp. 4N509B]|uniref:hypothetical protein n=1 Tax=Streptomyces sp. 4N509B TaxID=3457413 RepID=UPI003FD44CA1